MIETKYIYWKRIVFKTKTGNVYTKMFWHRCSSVFDCPYELKNDFEEVSKRINEELILIKVESKKDKK